MGKPVMLPSNKNFFDRFIPSAFVHYQTHQVQEIYMNMLARLNNFLKIIPFYVDFFVYPLYLYIHIF